MGYAGLPAYLKRDLRRIYGPLSRVSIPLPDINLLLMELRGNLASGKATVVEGYAWRRATGFSASGARSIFLERLGCGVEYRRRGDLMIIYPGSA